MRILTMLLGCVFSFAVWAQGPSVERYTQGVHYELLDKPVKTITPGKIEVTEAFAYSCGHCYNFEPLILSWEKKLADDVELVKLPVIWRNSMQPLARIMYTGKSLNKYKEVNARVFTALHKERKRLGTEDEIAKIFEDVGVSKEDFKKTYNSFSVNTQVKQAQARTHSMKITGTPQMIVDGRYSVAATREMGHEGMLEVVDFLVEKIRAEKASGKS